MTAFAVGKIFAERGLVIVTARAGDSGFGLFVHDDGRRVHIAASRRMTGIAIHKAVFVVAEIPGNRLARGQDVVGAADLVTLETFAGPESAPVLGRRMTFETRLMRRLAVRD
jgi:hypothetical protein